MFVCWILARVINFTGADIPSGARGHYPASGAGARGADLVAYTKCFANMTPLYQNDTPLQRSSPVRKGRFLPLSIFRRGK